MVGGYTQYTRNEIIETGFYGILLTYIVALLLRMPSDEARLFPLLVVPIIGILVVFRLLNILSQDRINQYFEGLKVDSPLSQFEQEDVEHESGTDIENIDKTELLKVTVWIAIGIGLIYIVGLLIGGWSYVTTFLYLYGGYDVKTSVGVATGLMIFLISITIAFGFSLWPGIVFA